MEEPNKEAVASSEQSPIDQLPDELLGSIFLLNTIKEVVDGQILHDPHATTLSSRAVCKRWYDVATSYPVFWSRIIDYERHPPTWVKELLRRSKSSLIEVGEDSAFKCVQVRYPRGEAVLHHMLEDPSRIKTLSLQIRFKPWQYICQNFLQYPAPNLEFLNLITSCPFPDCLYPGPLFADAAPFLRRVHLQRCLIDFSSPVLSNLTGLSVSDIVTAGILSTKRSDHPLKVAPTVGGWLRILGNIPSLRYLTLSSAISENRSDEEPLVNVSLPNLIFLTIGAKFHGGATFLEHLSIPPSCGIRLRFIKSDPDQDGAKLLAFLTNHLSHWPQDSPDRYLQAKILSGDRIHFGNSRRVGYIWDMTEEDVVKEHAQSSADPMLWLVISLGSSNDTLILFNQLLALYNLTYPTTTTLDLWIDEEFAMTNPNAPTFPALSNLHSFTALKSLSLLERSPVYLLPLFQYSSSQPNQPIFPALRTLRLMRTNFEDDQRVAYFTTIAFLLWRAEVRLPLVELQMIDSKMSKDTEESLSRLGNVKITVGSMEFSVDHILDED
ncbi:hypothetical protein M413DRAFT_447142 [Hebeloma cylindrosporum]|uniref:Uncharacterized protein n=1 Tax=Hebeloma cylindrosporum TaxID=76867 RepID=A0A0C3BSP8_HEBCY|nr:hypothetical protein M413DRAFT_447142 [Hebeloma cylindrosporum h7]